MYIVCMQERESRRRGDRAGILLGFSMQGLARLGLNSLGFSTDADDLLTAGQIPPSQGLKPLSGSPSAPASHASSAGRCFLS